MSITVRTTSGGVSMSLQQLVADVETIASYDGTVVEITVISRPCTLPSLIVPGKSLSAALTELLAEADAATSPHYTAPPQGQPFPARVAGARRAYQRHSQAFLAEALRRTMPTVCRNQDEFLRANWQQHSTAFRTSRGGYLDSQFKRITRPFIVP
jgi:hypothetical protein